MLSLSHSLALLYIFLCQKKLFSFIYFVLFFCDCRVLRHPVAVFFLPVYVKILSANAIIHKPEICMQYIFKKYGRKMFFFCYCWLYQASEGDQKILTEKIRQRRRGFCEKERKQGKWDFFGKIVPISFVPSYILPALHYIMYYVHVLFFGVLEMRARLLLAMTYKNPL